MAQTVRDPPTMQETRVRSLGRRDPLENEMATHSRIVAWRILCTEKPDRLQSTGLQSQTQLSMSTQANIFVMKLYLILKCLKENVLRSPFHYRGLECKNRKSRNT